MSQATLTAEQALPSNPELQQATIKALSARVKEADVRAFLEKAAVSVPAPIGATLSVNLAIWGKVVITPDGQPWKFDNTVWGGPAYFGSGAGFLYTAYDSWDAFFPSCTAFHVQGVDVGGGVLQVNFFNGDGVPVGQLNAAAGGVGLVEGGGSGGWTRT
jgi:hypothetical protein